MSELVVTTTTTANGTTDHTIKTGNTTGPVAVVYANGYIGVSNATGSDFLIADANVSYSNTQKGVFRGNMSAGPLESIAIHNLIINGGKQISQENGFTSSNATSVYPVDQFAFYYTGGHDISYSQNASVLPSENYSASVWATVNTTNASPNTANYIVYRQPIEGTFAKKLAWGTADAIPLTVGFWARCSSDLTISMVAHNQSNAAYIKEVALTGNTWTWNSFTIPANANSAWNSNTSGSVYLNMSLSCGTDSANSTLDTWLSAFARGSTTQGNFGSLGNGNTFHTTGWVAIPGEHTINSEDAHKLLLPYDYELQRCQRYYFKNPSTIYGGMYGSTSGFAATAWPVTMRASPSLSYSGVTTTTGLTAYQWVHWGGYLMTSTSPYVTGLTANARM